MDRNLPPHAQNAVVLSLFLSSEKDKEQHKRWQNVSHSFLISPVLISKKESLFERIQNILQRNNDFYYISKCMPDKEVLLVSQIKEK